MGRTMPNPITNDQILVILILDFIGIQKNKIASALGIQRSTVYNHLSDFSIKTEFLPSNLGIDSKDSKAYVRLSQFVNAGMTINCIHRLYQAHPPYFTSAQELKKTAILISLNHTSAPPAPLKTTDCSHCKQSFTPDCRHRHDQYFCSDYECRLASKRHSQRKWITSRGANYWEKKSK
jgi:uncharacterized CHY-type Zn-finger protein